VGAQVLGPVRLERLYVPDREVYFSAPAPEQANESFDTMVARFVVDPKRIEMAKDDGTGQLHLGRYSLRQSANQRVFFKTAVDNIKFDPATVVSVERSVPRSLIAKLFQGAFEFIDSSCLGR
jgi:hypothetical protein